MSAEQFALHLMSKYLRNSYFKAPLTQLKEAKNLQERRLLRCFFGLVDFGGSHGEWINFEAHFPLKVIPHKRLDSPCQSARNRHPIHLEQVLLALQVLHKNQRLILPVREACQIFKEDVQLVARCFLQ